MKSAKKYFNFYYKILNLSTKTTAVSSGVKYLKIILLVKYIGSLILKANGFPCQIATVWRGCVSSNSNCIEGVGAGGPFALCINIPIQNL